MKARIALRNLIVGGAMVLAGCGGNVINRGSLPPVSAGEASSPHARHADGYSVLYSFKNSPDGAAPEAGLIVMHGKIVGTTFIGGRYGAGTVFELNRSGAESVLYSFGAARHDGSSPRADLLDVDGELYGSDEGGGLGNGPGGGAVFAVSSTGKERVLYRFTRLHGPWELEGGLASVNGNLYGTTRLGGKCGYSVGCGTIFTIAKSGAEKVIHQFRGGSDGQTPTGSLINVDGALYGTTTEGGSGCGSGGCGTVFKVSTSGVERVLYSFKGGTDGAYPSYVKLTYLNGKLYGTTAGGGDSNGDGTVFEMSMTGEERVLYRFNGGQDGSEPFAGLTYVKGALYGTTFSSGSADWGTVFKVSLSGKESVLHSFGGPDGHNPWGGLAYLEGALYGTTEQGGENSSGIVFRISP